MTRLGLFDMPGNEQPLTLEHKHEHYCPNFFDERLVLDLPRGRGRLIGGDLNVGEEGSEQTIITLQSLHHGFVGYQHIHTRVDLAKKAYPCKCNREQTKLADECISS
jgi:hypothetical protein